MTVIANPSAVVDVTFEGATGLVGTLELGIYQGDTVIQALSAAGINEIGSSGLYVATRTMPGTAGYYQLVWTDDGTLSPDHVATEDLTVTSDGISATLGTGNLYLTQDEFKALQNIENETFEDEAIDLALNAACRACDAYKHTRFYTTSEVRLYSPDRYDVELKIDDLNALTSLTVDMDDDGVYEDTWVRDTDFRLLPVNALDDGLPYNAIRILSRSTKRFPPVKDSVKITGEFGWAECPGLVQQAAALLTRFFLESTKNAPLGVIIAHGQEAVATARLGKIHPAAAFLLDQVNPQQGSFHTVQLG